MAAFRLKIVSLLVKDAKSIFDKAIKRMNQANKILETDIKIDQKRIGNQLMELERIEEKVLDIQKEISGKELQKSENKKLIDKLNKFITE